MYLKYFSLLIWLYLRPSAASRYSCIESQCRVLVNESGAPTHDQFQSKTSETNVRMVYLNLKIGNNTYKLLEAEYKLLPMRWVWARSRTEHMLSLPYDYDILSLGLLKFQMRNMDVNLIEEPSGCLAKMPSPCRDVVVARTLLEDVTRERSTKSSQEPQAVCVTVLSPTINIFAFQFVREVNYLCCQTEKRVNKTLVYCGLGVKKNGWLTAFNAVLNSVTIVMLFYWPIVLFLLPDFCFTFRKEIVLEEELDQSSGNRTPAVLSSENQAVETEEVSTEVTVDIIAVNGRNESDAGVQLKLSSVDPTEEEELLTIAVNDRGESDVGCELNLSSENRSEPPSENRPVETEELLLEVTVDTIAVDDVSPITCTFFLQRCAKNFPPTSNYFKLFFLWFLLIPMPFYIILVLNLTVKRRYIDELFRKHDAFIQGRLPSIVHHINTFRVIDVLHRTFFLFFLPGYIMYSVAPSMQEKTNTKCHICKKPLDFRANMIEHLKMLPNKLYVLTSSKSNFEVLKEYGPYSISKNIFFWIDWIYPGDSGIKQKIVFGFKGIAAMLLVSPIYGILLVIYGALWGMICAFFLVKFIFCSVVYFLVYSPSYCILISIVKCAEKAIIWPFSMKKIVSFLVKIGAFYFVLMSSSMVAFCCRYVVQMFGFVIMGFIFNVKLTAPLLSFAFVLANNIYMCYSNVQKRYKEVKEMISEQWVKEEMSPPNADGKSDTIPTDLFFYVCNERGLLPITGEVCYMLLTIAVISISLFFAIAAIIFSDAMHDTSPLISVIAVFISGKIPELFFKGLMKETKFTGKDRIHKKEVVKKAVKQFIKNRKRSSKAKLQ